MRSILVFATFWAHLEAVVRHACQRDEDCGSFASSDSYPYQCCTTVVCNAAYDYFLVSSGCIAVPNPFRRCGKVAEASESGRFAVQLRIAQWREIQGRVGENCELARQNIPQVLGVEAPPRPDFLVPDQSNIPLKKDLLTAPSGADVFRRRFPTRTTTTLAPYHNVKNVEGRCFRNGPLRKDCDRRGGNCCIVITCQDPRSTSTTFLVQRQKIAHGETCASSCSLSMQEERTSVERIYKFTFPADEWEAGWFPYIDDNYVGGEPTSPLKDCAELRYYFYYLQDRRRGFN